ncbi:MAG: outer membrane beta-barrel protein [Bacteroidales bacterium]|nr:outer membrane beta-barrel protein [Bacteroidales bacterium]
MILLSGQRAWSQGSQVWDKATLKDSVVSLLLQCQFLHDHLNSQTDLEFQKEFMHLYANPNVQVINTLDGEENTGKISIDEFVSRVENNFPDGLMLDFDLKTLTIGVPDYDRNNRYVVMIRINQSLSGISNGKAYSCKLRVIYQIAFYNVEGAPGNFMIYGMDIPDKQQGYLQASVSPSLTGFSNSALQDDQRFASGGRAGFRGQISCFYYLTDHWGMGTGVNFSTYSGTLKLDSLDAVGGFSPNMRDVLIKNKLQSLEIPVLFAARTHSYNKLEIRADIGLSLGIRLFESWSSSAVNRNTGAKLEHVISDSDWINSMRRVNLGLQGDLSVFYHLSDRLDAFIGAGMRQGISGLDKNTNLTFNASKYLGQYNPLWGAPGKTVNQAYYIYLGMSVLLNQDKN